MATRVLMPALSPTKEEGKHAKWLVADGDAITSGMIIAEIETDNDHGITGGKGSIAAFHDQASRIDPRHEGLPGSVTLRQQPRRGFTDMAKAQSKNHPVARDAPLGPACGKELLG